MRILNALRTALRDLRRNITRALLTMLGIVIGIGSVIAMMEIGQGSSSAIQKTIASMGSNTLIIRPGTSAYGGVSAGTGAAVTLTVQDRDAILAECPSVRQAAVLVRVSAQIIYGNRNWSPNTIFGTAPEYLDVRDWKSLAEGDAFTERDVRNNSKVCLIGQTVKRELFGDESPVGKEIRMANVTLKVIGDLTPKGANLVGMDQDDIILAPWTTIKYRVSNRSGGGQTSAAASSTTSGQTNTLSNLYPTQQVILYPQASASQQMNNPMPVRFANIDQIVAAAASTEGIPNAIKEITALLRERHRLRPEAEDDFDIRDMTELTRTLTSTSKLTTNMLLFVALISLIVGGVGIMNIMLVSVTERTREIGLKLAVGAKGRDILMQFLVEAVVLCLLGGIVGIGLGRGVSILIAAMLRWPTEISVNAIVASVLVSSTVGIVFGFYPAWRAARLDPIEALRYE